jgi:hypothetical protein
MLSEIFLDRAPQIQHSFSRTTLGRNIKSQQKRHPTHISVFSKAEERVEGYISHAISALTSGKRSWGDMRNFF